MTARTHRSASAPGLAARLPATCLVWLLAGLTAWPQLAADRLLRDALRKDETIGDISTRYGQLSDRQQSSSVFEPPEVQGTEAVRTRVDTARSTAMKDVLTTLSSGLAAGTTEEQARVRDGTRQHYQRLLEILRNLRPQHNQDLQDRQVLRELLEEQQRLLTETQEVQQATADKPMGMDTVNRLADLAGRQEELQRQAATEPVRQPMQQAERSLSDLRPAEAVTHQQEAVRQLQIEIARTETAQAPDANAPSNRLQELVARVEEMTALARSLERLEGKLREVPRRKEPPPPRFQQETAVEMNDAAQRLRQLPLPPAADEVMKGIPKMMEEKWEPSADHVRTARDLLEQARQQLLEQIRQAAEQQQAQQTPPADQPQPAALQPAQTNQPRPPAAGQQTPPPPTAESWQTRLPENERAAVLAARDAAYNPKWEHEVKRYFLELAK